MSFLDKLKQGVSEASTKTKTTIDVNRLRLQISGKQKEIQDKYRDMGELTYRSIKNELQDQEANETIHELAEEIAKIEEDIQSIQIRIKELSALKTCPSCQNDVDIDVRYCSHCGYQFEVVVTPTVQEEVTRVCHQCGASLDDDGKFCTECGADQSAESM